MADQAAGSTSQASGGGPREAQPPGAGAGDDGPRGAGSAAARETATPAGSGDDDGLRPPSPNGGTGRGRVVGLDMIRSLGLVTLALLGWLLVSHPRTPTGIATVDWRPTAQSAAATASYPVLAPPTSWAWMATSARIEPQPDGTIAWRVGFYTPDEDYAALLQRGVFPDQAAGSRRDWIDTETRAGQPAGTVELEGRTWTRLVGDPHPDERRSLMSADGGTVTILTGTAQWPELESLARSLQRQDQPG